MFYRTLAWQKHEEGDTVITFLSVLVTLWYPVKIDEHLPIVKIS